MDSTAESNLFRRVSVARLMQSAALRHCLLVLLSYSLLFLVFFSPVILRGSLPPSWRRQLIYLSVKLLLAQSSLGHAALFRISHDGRSAGHDLVSARFLYCRLLPNAWNVFMIMAYVAGSSFMYGYVCTRSLDRGLPHSRAV